MPVDWQLYPKDWKAISRAIRERSGDCCEGSPMYPHCRARNGERHPVTGSRVVLTVAHLDHNPSHCDFDNLRAWCQRCHLTYDALHHAESRRRRLQKAKSVQQPDLFEEAA
jgi:hypothetical protein